jgi:hypothetical protein
MATTKQKERQRTRTKGKYESYTKCDICKKPVSEFWGFNKQDADVLGFECNLLQTCDTCYDNLNSKLESIKKGKEINIISKKELYVLFIEKLVKKGIYLGDYLFDSNYQRVTKKVKAEMLDWVNECEDFYYYELNPAE